MSSEFEFLACRLGLVLLPFGLGHGQSRDNGCRRRLFFVFVNIVRPVNPMTYDLADTLNTGLAIIVGVLFGTLSYLLIFPPDPQAARRYVTYRIRRGVGVARPARNRFPHFSPWETRMYDRVIRLNDPQNLSGTPTDEWLDAGLGALTLGNEILRLRRWLATEKLSAELRAAVRKSHRGVRQISCPSPSVPSRRSRIGCEQLAQLDPGPGQPGRRAWARILGALAEIDVYLAHHPRLLIEAVT